MSTTICGQIRVVHVDVQASSTVFIHTEITKARSYCLLDERNHQQHMGDRSGGREVKGASLKKSKKNPGSVAARGMKKKAEVTPGPTTSVPPPRPSLAGLHFDCGAALLSRQFDRDRDRVLQRARTEGSVEAVVLWFSDVEKQQQLADVCKDNLGLCYNMCGVHPDNIQNTNKRSHETWLVKIEEIARRPECVAILSGLNLQRELATHFAQETLLKASCALADRLLLPLVLHIAGDGASLDKATELLRGEGWIADDAASASMASSHRVILHDIVTTCAGDASIVDAAVQAGFYCSVSAAGLTDTDETLQANAKAAVARIPISQMLVCSDSPWKTPQNLPDPYLRTMRNEPSNLPSVVAAIAEALSTDAIALAVQLKANAMRVFGMEFLPDDAATSAAEVHAKVDTGVSGGKREKKSKEEAQEEAGVSTAKKGVSKGKGKGKVVESESEEEEDDEDEEEEEEEDEEDNDRNVVADVAVDSVGDALRTAQIASAGPYYSCQKCRMALFAQASVLSHGLGAARTVFKVGDEGLCSAAIFLSHEAGHAPSSGAKAKAGAGAGKGKAKGKGKHTEGGGELDEGVPAGLGYAVVGTNVECAHCGTKLGRFSAGEASCPCGAVVAGPAVRIAAAKVDFVDGSLDAFQLAERSRQEAAERLLLGDEEEEEEDDVRKKSKKKKLKSENRGNFSSFRNKSFIPNASRVAKKNAEDDKAQRLVPKGQGKAEGEEDEETDEGDDEEEVAQKPKPQGKKPSPVVTSAFGALDSDDDDDDDDDDN